MGCLFFHVIVFLIHDMEGKDNLVEKLLLIIKFIHY